MGLLDSVLGQVLAGSAQGQPQQPGAGDAGGLGGLGDLGALVASLGGSQGATAGAGGGLGGLGGLGGVLGSLLANDGPAGGLGGVLGKFQQAGLGDAADSWVGTGDNQQVSPDQVHQALGSDVIGDLSSKLGINASTLLPLLAAALPMLINHFTPKGEVPAQGVGSQDDVLASLSNMLPKG